MLQQPIYKLLGASRTTVRAYASGGWAPGDAAEQEMAGYASKGFSAVKVRAGGRDGFTIAKSIRCIAAVRGGIGPDVERMVDAHGSLDVSTAIRLAKRMEECTALGAKQDPLGCEVNDDSVLRAQLLQACLNVWCGHIALNNGTGIWPDGGIIAYGDVSPQGDVVLCLGR